VTIFSYNIRWPDNISGRFASNVLADILQAVFSGLTSSP